ncbi:MAG: phage tail protein [Bacteroidota bacterium]|nr:phage tail protein [Bacteroidota bacterium]
MDIPKDPPFYPAAFSFKVNVVGINGSYEGSFQEVSGISIKLGSISIKEGGENRFEHRLPNPPKYENLVLKRGMILNSKLITWARDAVENFTIKPKNVIVNLIDDTSAPLASWSFKNAYPVSLKISDLKAQDNAIVLETLELSYAYFTRVY